MKVNNACFQVRGLVKARMDMKVYDSGEENNKFKRPHKEA
jgi:hypothetical protein